MAKYKRMGVDQHFNETLLVLPGGIKNDHYSIGINRMRIVLTPEEKDAIVETWSKIDSGELGG